MKTSIISLLMIGTTLTMMASNGAELYKKCAGCHGENGEMTALQKSAVIAGQESNLTIKELTAYKNGELNQYGLGGIMKSQLIDVSEEDIEALAEYIENMEKNASK